MTNLGVRMASRQFFRLIKYQDGRIRVWRHRSECTLAASIRLRHTGPSSGVMVRGAIGYMFRSPLVRIDGTLNSARYISGVLRPVVLPFIRALRNSMIRQDNARPTACCWHCKELP
ncbi:UNVERIFIED_CONTAM: hypothetical protein NCL1_43694 [Trichonephila clavipes]